MTTFDSTTDKCENCGHPQEAHDYVQHTLGACPAFAPAPRAVREWPYEDICRLIHDNAGTKSPDEPWPHPAQKSWEEPILKRWQQWEGLVDELRELLGYPAPTDYELFTPAPQQRADTPSS